MLCYGGKFGWVSFARFGFPERVLFCRSARRILRNDTRFAIPPDAPVSLSFNSQLGVSWP